MSPRRLVFAALAGTAALTLATPAAAGQGGPELSAGLAILHVKSTGVGVNVAALFPVRTTSSVEISALGGMTIVPNIKDRSFMAFGGGIRMMFIRHPKIHPFFQVLAGIGHTGIASDEKNDPDATGGTGAGVTIGGGIRTRFNPKLDLFVMISLAAAKGSDETLKGFQISGGLVIPIGARK